MKFKLTPKQAEFVGAFEQYAAYVAAVGTGKTLALIVKALFHSQETDGNLGVIVRKNFTDLRDSTIKDFEKYSGFHVNESKKECILPNGSTILFRHGDELPVLKNLNLGWFGIEQAEEFDDDTTWLMLQHRLRRDCAHRNGFMIANTNGHNWIWNLFKKNGPPKNHILVEATTKEHVDLGLLPPDFYENAVLNQPAKLFKRYYENSWEVTEGLVYDEFDQQKHVVAPFNIPDTWERGFVLDHGQRNPTAVLWYAIDYDGNVWLYDEHYESGKTPSHHSEKIKLRGLTQGYCDPSVFNKITPHGDRWYSIADEYQESGITLQPAARSDEVAAIARVNEFFKAGRIKVFKTLSHFLSEIQAWKWKEVKPSATVLNLPEVPQDKDNHLMDDLKYLIASRFPESEKPKEKAPIHSLDWYDEQAEKRREELMRNRNARR